MTQKEIIRYFESTDVEYGLYGAKELCDEYAKSQCIAFVEWIRVNNYQYDDVKDCYEYHDSNAAGSYGLKFLCKTTDELYTLFLNHQ
jgi:hypothetical protein